MKPKEKARLKIYEAGCVIQDRSIVSVIKEVALAFGQPLINDIYTLVIAPLSEDETTLAYRFKYPFFIFSSKGLKFFRRS